MTDIIRTGDYRIALATDECDSMICDPPFGAKTHEGARTTAEHDQQGITYTCWRSYDVKDFVSWAVPRTRRWIFAMTSHDLIEPYMDYYSDNGFYPFAPIAIVMLGMGVRKQGDGPSSWTIYGMTARARNRKAMDNQISNGTALWRALPGAYVWHGAGSGNGRGKPVSGMADIVCDYSNPGDVVMDPFAGEGSTLQAALIHGRVAIGSEIDPAVAYAANVALQRQEPYAANPTSQLQAKLPL